MFVRFKRFLTRLWENKTGRKCSRCKYNCADHCTHPSDEMFTKCWHSITRPGFAGRYERPVRKRQEELLAQGRAAAEGLQAGMAAAKDTSNLTAEEQHQLDKIKTALQEAGDTARDGGLLED